MERGSSELIESDDIIISKIYYIRGYKVMLDRDLADMYGVEPRRLREQVKRNGERLPANFMFQLTESEADNMVSQNAIPSRKHLGGHLPYAFTEHGVLMLANILRTKTAMQVSVRIIEIFVKMRELLSQHKDILLKLEQLENKVAGHDEDIKLVFAYLKKLLPTSEQTDRRRIGFRRPDEEQ